jgi:hypothetical protein
VNRRTGGAQFAAERVTIAKFAMVGFGVRVCGCPDILKIGFRQWPLVCWQDALGRSTGAEEKNCDERCKNSEGKVTTLGVGQGGSPAKLLTVIHSPCKPVFWDFLPMDFTQIQHTNRKGFRIYV